MADNELFGNSEQLDIISRSVAIEALNEYFSRIGKLKRRGLNNAENAIRLDTVGVIKTLPSAQPSATDTNVATTDTISRAAVVDAIDGVDWYHQNQHGEMVHGANPDEHQAWYKAEDIYKAVESVPPAQQWISCSERLPETSGQYYVSGGGKVWICEFLIISTPIGGRIGGWCNNAANPIVQAWMEKPEPWKGDTP